jgi:hypothetical protein
VTEREQHEDGERRGWIGVDFDGTLATYHGWRDDGGLGEPVPAMVERVKAWVNDGQEVRIFTARMASRDSERQRRAIESWCMEHLGFTVAVTNVKDFRMRELWDDRAVSVELNTGRCTSIGREDPVTP